MAKHPSGKVKVSERLNFPPNINLTSVSRNLTYYFLLNVININSSILPHTFIAVAIIKLY